MHYPETWDIGPALNRDKQNYFTAEDYDHIVDSPILMGRLSRAELDINGSKIEIYTYSKTGKVQSEQILESVKDILLAAADFLDGLPVECYTFYFMWKT